MSLKDLERRVAALEDIEAIKRLKAHYAQVLDGFSNARVEDLFTEDGVWDIETRGRFVGRQAIREFSIRLRELVPFSIHYFVQPEIRIGGEKAEGRWYMWLPATKADGGAVWSAAIEDDKYVKVNEKWFILELKFKIIFRTPYEEGWHKKRFAT